MTARLLRTMNGGIDLEVACDFGAGYVDITSYVNADGISVIRGRRDEASQVEPSRLVLTVNNTDGRFTPNNLDSPYWPGVKFRTPIRMRVRHPHTSGTWFTRFTGFVDEWPIEWPAHPDVVAWSRISASGVLRRLSRGKTVPTPIRRRMPIAAPDVWWPLEETERQTVGRPAIGATGKNIIIGRDPVNFGTVEGTQGMHAKVVGFGPAGDFGPAFLRLPSTGVVPRTFEVWVRGNWTGMNEALIYLLTGSGASTDTFVIYATSSKGVWGCGVGSLNVDTGVTAVDSVQGGWWHVVAVNDNVSGDMFLYVNGALVGSDTTGSGTFYPQIGGEIVAPSTTTTEFAIAHVAIYDTPLSSSDVLVNYNVGTGWIGELAADRFLRLGVEQDVTTSATASTGHAMGAQPTVGLVDALQDCADADAGMMYENLSGDLTLQICAARNSPATYLSLTLSQINDLLPVRDDQLLLNDVSATRPGGEQAETYINQASVDDYGAYSRNLSINVADDDLLFEAAAWAVNSSSDPDMPRYPTVSMRFATPPDVSALVAWLAGEPLGGKIALSNLPAQMGQATDSVFIEGYTETWSYAFCQVVANCTPGELRDRIFILESGGDLSAWNLDGQTVSSGINESVVSLSVATVAGKPLVTTAAGDYPRKWRNVDTGEVFEVTACSGVSSPQTLTITRGQNGTTAAAMSVGDVFELAIKPVLAY